MFGSSKPAASLSSGLLARKGQARPAMRPGFVSLAPSQHDDLGWNDMGEDHGPELHAVPPAHEPVPAAPIPEVLREREVLETEFAKPEPAIESVPETRIAEPEPVESEPVVQEAAQPQAVAVHPAPEPAPAPLPRKAAKQIAPESPVKVKSAFTLRLDNDRHLRLRLASAVTHRSAQHLVTEALDAFLKQLPEVEALVRQLPTSKAE